MAAKMSIFYLQNTGKPWASNTISAILRNPTYMGYLTYAQGKEKEVRSSAANPELVIISEEKWHRVQAIRAGRNPEQTKKHGVEVMVKNTKGEMLLIGLARCGHCQHVLSSTPNYKKYILQDGTKIKQKYMMYRCSGKGLKKAVDCEGQTLYSKKRLENVVIDEVLRYLDHLEQVDLTSKLNELKKRNSSTETTQLQRLSKDLDDAREEMKTYKAEVILSLKGTGKFTSELLNELIGETAQRISKLEEQVEQVRRQVEAKRIEKKELETLKQHIPNWRKVFNQASVQQKQMMLRTIIGGIEVRKDGIKIHYKLRISQFIGTMGVDGGNQVDANKVIV
ncbi:recombinase family protein [Brevibacillus fluminis]|uniref:recombinase family protein n=1 Tax=Brevibacillus fluminis TaxID=511487 RepID=UPI003F8A17AD